MRKIVSEWNVSTSLRTSRRCSDMEQKHHFVYDWSKRIYRYKEKNSAGQTMVFEVRHFMDNDGRHGDKMYVVFYIMTKRTDGYQQFKQTGKCGLEGLVFAKECLIDFITWWKSQFKRRNLRIYVRGDDRRRFEIYKHFLVPLGFHVQQSRFRLLFFDTLKDDLTLTVQGK